MENNNFMIKHCTRDTNITECSTKMNDILEEFTKLYTEKLERINEVESEQELKRKVAVLESWVRDLGEQNGVLVATVEDLEREAAHRVALLQERLDKMALATRESCVALRDHQGQMTSLVTQKLSVEEDLERLQDKVSHLQDSNSSLLQDNSHLRHDLDNLLQVISESSSTGQFDYASLTFKYIQPNLVFGSNQGRLFDNVSPSQPDHCTEFGEQNNSLTSNTWTDGEEKCLSKLRSEMESLKKLQRETTFILTQRDEHIADLQSQLTDVHHKLAAAQAHVNTTTSTLHNLLDRGRHDSFEICRRDDVIRQLLSPTRHLNPIDQTDSKSKLDVELQLSANIDVMALRLSDLEEECQRLRHQNTAFRSALKHQPQNEAQKYSLLECKEPSYDDRKAIGFESRTFASQETQTANGATTSDAVCQASSGQNEAPVRPPKEAERRGFEFTQILKLENELSEKNILVLELQSHLENSREEIRLKDQTLANMEQKLLASRRSGEEKEERLLYLTSQLTSLQLEVSRLHGNGQHLRVMVEKKSLLINKLEAETESLTRQLNERSSAFEDMQREIALLRAEAGRRRTENSEQKLTIGSLQDALTASKLNGDRLRSQLETQDSGSCTCRGRSKMYRRIHKEHRCSCRRARSAHSQEEMQLLELNAIIDELNSYLKEAEQMAQTVEEERDLLEKTLDPSQFFHLRETRRQKETLQKIREDSTYLMFRLQPLRDNLTKCVSDLPSRGRRSLSPRPRHTRSRVKDEQHLKINAEPSTEAGKAGVEADLRHKMVDLEYELKREKADKEMLSNDANAVISSVRQWLHFQKAANSHLEDKFNEQKKHISTLTKENQRLESKLKVLAQPTGPQRIIQANEMARADENTDSWVTNDTGIEGSSTMTTPNSPSTPRELFWTSKNAP